MKYMVSIIIPVYNCEKYLGRAVESVINQPNFDNLELVLIDDGSKDGSGKICDEFSEKYENIFAFHQPNSGVSVARNLGISKANGDWIAFLDSDDWFLDGAFIKMLRYDDSDLICCDYTSDESCNGCLSDRFVKSVYTKNEFNDTLYRAMINGTSFYSCWNKLYKKSIIIDNDVQFPAGVKYGEDMMFLFTYIKYINSFAFVNEALYFYWINPQNTTSVIKKGFEYCLNQYEWQYKYFNEIECKNPVVFKLIRESFVYRTVLCVVTAGSELGTVAGIKYIKMIINNEIFVHEYALENYQVFKCRFDRYLNMLINKKMPIILYLYINYNNIRTKISK